MGRRLGEGVVVRSDDVVGNEVLGMAWAPSAEGRSYAFVALFTDDGEVIDCRLDEAPAE